jgi:hypothetical protein
MSEARAAQRKPRLYFQMQQLDWSDFWVFKKRKQREMRKHHRCFRVGVISLSEHHKVRQEDQELVFGAGPIMRRAPKKVTSGRISSSI